MPFIALSPSPFPLIVYRTNLLLPGSPGSSLPLPKPPSSLPLPPLLCPISSLYVSITHGNQHVEHVSVAQAWGCACSGWTVWVFAGSCVGLASDFSANDCVTSIYIQMCFCKFRSRISIEVINESQMFYAQHFCLCFPPFVGLFCLSRFCQKRGNVLVKTWYYFICGGLAWAVKLSEQGWRSGTSLCTCLRLDLLESALWDILSVSVCFCHMHVLIYRENLRRPSTAIKHQRSHVLFCCMCDKQLLKKPSEIL